MDLRRAVLVMFWLAASAATARGDDAEKSQLAQQARAIFERNCYRCHGQDGRIEGGLNYLLDTRTLIARRKVVPGDAAGSRIFKRLTSETNPMPPEDEKVRPSQDDIAVIKRWIEAGAPESADVGARAEFLSDAEVLQILLDDLDALPARTRPFIRYFTLTNLANAGLSEDQMQTYRHALSKLVNSLSWDQDITVPRAIDPGRTILGIDLRDYRWNAQTWQRILEAYPYAVLPLGPTARSVCFRTSCDLPFLRADWFVFAASRPPLYHDLLRLPKTDRELERSLRIDVRANIAEESVARAGFNSSGVSRNNRLIERHRSPHGAYWKSYDFAGNADRQNLFAHPLGPGEDDSTFRHDGGEIIFNLPNGLQAYLLVDGKGNRIDTGPTAIVSVKNRPDPTVINGVSCMGCHARGMIDKADQVRAHVDRNPGAFEPADVGLIRVLYTPEAEFRSLLQKDAARFGLALEATGVKPGATEPVAALADRFEAELDLAAAAAEVGQKRDGFLHGLERSAELAQRLGPLRVPGGTVQRQVLLTSFDDLVPVFDLGIPLASLRAAIAEQTEAIRRNPRDPAAYFERGNLHYDRGGFEQAVADYTEAIRREHPGAQAYLNRGMAEASRGELERAIADYGEALRRDRGRQEAYHNRALAFARQGAWDKALLDLNELVRLEPGSASAFADRGLAHAQRGQLDQAIADYTEALRLDPHNAGACERRGDAWRATGDTERAVADYTAVLANAPGAVFVRHKRGLAQRDAGEYEKALADLTESVRLRPSSARLHNDLARLLATCPRGKLRDGQRALEHAVRACDLARDPVAEFLDTRAAAHAECDQFDQAIAWAMRAIQIASETEKPAIAKRLALYREGMPYRERGGKRP